MTERLAAGAVLLALVGVLAVTARQGDARRTPWHPELAGPKVAIVPAVRAGRGGGSRLVLSRNWVSSTVRRTGIPEPAVRAYGRATLLLARERPGCHLGWTTLAGIGWVESQHGTIGGRTLRADGRPSRRIIGPALDGRRYARIAGTSTSARWHGDRRWDHAVGPMQFIPSTWRRWAADGDGDHRRDPHNVFDASYATARYLCASGLDLRTGAGWTAAVRSYNHSDAYVADVLNTANGYAASG
jgi:membrane-bound lytic murein transglycosylase B